MGIVLGSLLRIAEPFVYFAAPAICLRDKDELMTPIEFGECAEPAQGLLVTTQLKKELGAQETL